jgi:hypothetical protein
MFKGRREGDESKMTTRNTYGSFAMAAANTVYQTEGATILIGVPEDLATTFGGFVFSEHSTSLFSKNYRQPERLERISLVGLRDSGKYRFIFTNIYSAVDYVVSIDQNDLYDYDLAHTGQSFEDDPQEYECAVYDFKKHMVEVSYMNSVCPRAPLHDQDEHELIQRKWSNSFRQYLVAHRHEKIASYYDIRLKQVLTANCVTLNKLFKDLRTGELYNHIKGDQFCPASERNLALYKLIKMTADISCIVKRHANSGCRMWTISYGAKILIGASTKPVGQDDEAEHVFVFNPCDYYMVPEWAAEIYYRYDDEDDDFDEYPDEDSN